MTDIVKAAKTLANSCQKHAVLIKPYDDEDVICGQGTVGYELNQQIKEQEYITP